MLGVFARLPARLAADRRAVTALEYGLIAGLIAIVVIGSITRIGTSLSGTFSTIARTI